MTTKKTPAAPKPNEAMQVRHWTLLRTKTQMPTMEEIEAANRLVLSVPLKPGQYRYGSLIKVQGGTSITRYRLMGRAQEESAPSRITVPIRRTVTFPPGTPPHIKERLLAARARPPVVCESAVPTAKEPNGLALGDIPTQEVLLAELKTRYEEGLSLDVLCKQYRIGKSRLSKLLRQAGTEMRKAGRQPRQDRK